MEQKALLDSESVAVELVTQVRPPVGSGRLKSWQAYGFAVLVTVATLGLRLALASQMGTEPTLIMFTLPIMLSAYLGGLQAGLLSTGLSFFLASYYLLPPIHSFAVAETAQRWNVFFVMLAGVVISALNEALHRARHRAGIAARKQQAAAILHDSEQRYRALVEWSPESIAVHRGGKVIFVNPAAVKMFGATAAQELVGKPIRELIHPDFHEIALARVQVNADQGGLMPMIEQKFLKLDGTVIDVETQGIAIAYEGEPATFSSIRDITARKQAEIATIRLAAIVESTDDAVISKDLKSVITSWNRGAEKIFGHTAGAMVGTSIMQLIPADRQAEEAHILAKIKRGESVEHFETQRLTRDGRLIDVSVTASPIKDVAGQVIGVSKMARDITERKQLEHEIQQLNTELEQRVAERTAQLEAANKELEAFSYSVSHDLRAPLRGVDGYVRMLKEDCADQLNAEGNRLLEVVSSEAKRMGQLIDDLLAFSRLGREQMESTSIDMTALARGVFESLPRTVLPSTTRFELKPLPPTQGDLSMLRQVFANLIGNAVKFSSHQANPVIEIGGGIGDGETSYYVKDNGVGFDEKFRHKLFGVFQRLHSEAEFEGTGVGLALVQRVIKRHGGSVRGEGKLNQGAIFSFTLPIQKEPAHEPSR